jgi:hypothetical protein
VHLAVIPELINGYRPVFFPWDGDENAVTATELIKAVM